MKLLFLFAFLLLGAEKLKAQKFALIDKNLKQPVLFTDSLTVTQLTNYFPVEVKYLDSLYANLSYVKGYLNVKTVNRFKLKSFKISGGNTIVKTEAVPHAYGDSHTVSAITTAGSLVSEYRIGFHKERNKGVIKRIDELMNYLKNDKSLKFNIYSQYEPTLIEQTIFSRSQ